MDLSLTNKKSSMYDNQIDYFNLDPIHKSNIFFAKGDKYFKNKDYLTAKDRYYVALDFNNNNDQIHNKLAITLKQLGVQLKNNSFFKKAEQHYLKAIQINNKQIYYLNLGKFYLLINNEQQAIKTFIKMTQISQQNFEGFLQLGIVLEKQNKFQQAIKKFQESIMKNPKCYEAYVHCGSCHYMLCNYDIAIAKFNKAIQIDSDCFYPYYNLGIIYDKLQIEGSNSQNYSNYLMAQQYYKKAIQKGDSRFEPYYNIGCILMDMQKYYDAIKPLQNSVQINGTHYQSHFQLGKAYKYIGQYKKAIAQYQCARNINFNGDQKEHQAFTDTQNIFHPSFNIGVCYNLLGKHQQALKEYQNLLKLTFKVNKKYIQIYLNIAYTSKFLGNLQYSKLSFLKVVQKDSENYISYFNLGTISLEQKQYQIAINYFLNAIKYNAKGYHLYINLGIAYRYMESYSQAIKQFLIAIQINPKQHIAYFNLGFTFLNLGQYAKAQQYFDKAIERNQSIIQKIRDIYSKNDISQKYNAKISSIALSRKIQITNQKKY